ncbi:hypothetical protein G7Z17_g9213 [Cylindrodendrum hubeiense]|uniref:ABM domain-containing protein n=1 Tax=Cylindrodendrum hubeiense TaxID=595255 RepID=A0A9P5L8C9_9HYPO|nr:hypothetical protein G7Z17_g9213 [Cylindrodendrum hubeiense]
MPSPIEFLLIKFKPVFVSDPSAPPAVFSSVVSQLKAVPGVTTLYLGQPIEKPGTWVLGTRWESRDKYEAFIASSASTDFHAALRALLDQSPIINPIADYTHDVDGALNAPCTEFCTCWGVDESFHEERMHPFADPLDAAGLKGFYGMARGTFVQPAHEDPSVIPGIASRILLGWDSKEVHMSYKDVGSVIDDNVHLIMDRRKELEMYHVPLQKL